MRAERIDLYRHFNLKRESGSGGYLDVYAPFEVAGIKPKLRPAMLVIAGGAYTFISQRESAPVAVKYVANGYCAFVLNYSVNTAYPVPLVEACMAVAYIRENASKYRVDKNLVAAIGFSAGGHLATMLANIYDEKEVFEKLGNKTQMAKFNAVVLSYPVVTMGQFAHEISRDIITGNNPDLYEKLSMEKRVTANSVPAFIWHTFEDNCVPVENSLMLAEAYRRANVPLSLHIFEKGWHGMSLCNEEVNDRTEDEVKLEHVGKWFELSLDLLKARGFSVKTMGI